MTEKTDYELLNGDSANFAELHSRHSEFINSFLYFRKLVRKRSDVDDIRQLVWIRIHGKRDKYNPKWSFKTWAAQLAVRVSLNFYRAQAARPCLTNQSTLELFVDPQETRDPLVVEETTKRVREAVDSLPGNAKEAIEAVYFSNMRFVTAKYHQGYKRGRRLLKGTLRKLNDELSTA